MEKPTIRQFIIQNHKIMTAEDMVKGLVKLGYGKRSATNMLARLRKEIKIEYAARIIKDPPRSGISVKEFTEQNDVFLIVEKAARGLERGYLYEESTFIKDFLPRKSSYRAALEHANMKKYRGRAAGKWYWGNPSDIDDLKRRSLLNN